MGRKAKFSVKVLFLEQYSHLEGPKESDKPVTVHFDDIYYTFEDFVKFTLDFLADFFRKVLNMSFGG